MLDTSVVASVDPIPLPAPTWLLTFFLLFTFVLHVVPMSVTLGGGFWAIWAAGRADRPAYRELAARLGRWLPYWTAAAVTTGVAVLLFLQVLYGPVFYAASVVLAWPWLSVIGLLLVGYYGYYFRAYRFAKNPTAAFYVGVVAWLAFALIAFIFVNQMTLMLHPERHLGLYLASARGLHTNLAEPTLLPRYLHMLVGAVAVAALWVAGLGALALRRGESEAGRAVLVLGATGFISATALEMLLGFFLLLAQPHEVLSVVASGAAGPLGLVLALALALSAMRILLKARTSNSPSTAVLVGAGHLVVVIVLMVLIRHLTRQATLGGALAISAMPVAPQWGLILAFVVLLVAGLATVGWMLRALSLAKAARPG
ncbi:MAG TPA: hypothetical protein VMG32_11555 [Anaeromyxobacteraceae bacterium]|nr:hypothetical protein [Anaeromyxobacteraceae bacterium]